jgi:hypothetical protein
MKLRKSSVKKFSRCPIPIEELQKKRTPRLLVSFFFVFVLSHTTLQEARLQILPEAISFEVCN